MTWGFDAVTAQPKISVKRAAAIAREVFSVRRLVCRDNEFPGALAFWEALGENNPNFTMKVYPERVKNKAGIIAFEERVKLLISRDFVDRAKRGETLSNFILAHEFCHVALDHHGHAAVIKNFDLSLRSDGFAIEAPDDEELETNYATVFLLCGPAIMDASIDAVVLAKKAHCDIRFVKKAVAGMRLPEFKAEWDRLQRKIERVTL